MIIITKVKVVGTLLGRMKVCVYYWGEQPFKRNSAIHYIFCHLIVTPVISVVNPQG